MLGCIYSYGEKHSFVAGLGRLILGVEIQEALDEGEVRLAKAGAEIPVENTRNKYDLDLIVT